MRLATISALVVGSVLALSLAGPPAMESAGAAPLSASVANAAVSAGVTDPVTVADQATEGAASRTMTTVGRASVVSFTSTILAGVRPYKFNWCMDNSAPHRSGQAIREWTCHGGTRPANQTWTSTFRGNILDASLQVKYVNTGQCLVNYQNRADLGPCTRAPPLTALWDGGFGTKKCYYSVVTAGGLYLTSNGPYAQLVWAHKNTEVPASQEFCFSGLA